MIENELVWRLSFFVGILAVIGLFEYIYPRRKLYIKHKIRWFRNLSLILINNLTARFFLPFSATITALYAADYQIGVLYYFSLPPSMAIIFTVILLDLIIYTQHFAFHHIPLLWRLHKIHHIDQEIDVTTALRFHPVEILLSVLIKCAAVLLIGAPVIAVIIFEILLNATAMFNHGNLNLPKKLDKYLRWFIVTPDMHRIHHSVIISEINRNFGFNLPYWDRIFGTYQDQPKEKHTKMKIGLVEHQDLGKTRLVALLLMPFCKRGEHE